MGIGRKMMMGFITINLIVVIGITLYAASDDFADFAKEVSKYAIHLTVGISMSFVASYIAGDCLEHIIKTSPQLSGLFGVLLLLLIITSGMIAGSTIAWFQDGRRYAYENGLDEALLMYYLLPLICALLLDLIPILIGGSVVGIVTNRVLKKQLSQRSISSS